MNISLYYCTQFQLKISSMLRFSCPPSGVWVVSLNLTKPFNLMYGMRYELLYKVLMYKCCIYQGSGTTLTDQALTANNVPVIVDKCLTHIYLRGLDWPGIYRNSAQESKIKSLLDQFKQGKLRNNLESGGRV